MGGLAGRIPRRPTDSHDRQFASTVQFAPKDWLFSFDTEPVLAFETRGRILQLCADEELLTLFYHQASPGLGKVTIEDGIFIWNPIQ